MQHYADARTALIKRGLSEPTRRALSALSRRTIERLYEAGADPREIEREELSDAKAILHREAMRSWMEGGDNV